MTGKLKHPGVSPRKYLLFDDALTDTKRGFTLTVNPAVRTERPVLTREHPWEACGITGSVSLMEEEGLYKLWYAVRIPPAKGHGNKLSRDDIKGLGEKTLADLRERGTNVVCCATSRDAVHWDKPDLGVFEYRGSKKNNMVFEIPNHGTVFRDPSARSDKRYKMIFGGGLRMPHIFPERNIPPQPGYHGIHGAYSPDGIHWRAYRKPIMPWYTDTTNYAYWDDRIRKYVAYVRRNHNFDYKDGKTYLWGDGRVVRDVARAESEDFRSFPSPVSVLSPPPKAREPYATGWDFYNAAPVKYSYAADAYFLFPSVFYHAPDVRDVHLATSRDGVHYKHVHHPFVGLGQPGDFDSMGLYMAMGMIRRGNEINMVYVGFDFPHGVRELPHGFGAVGRVRLRLDGFVSQDARWSGGSLTTVPITFEGTGLELNMDANAGGSLRVELMDSAGSAIGGYTRQEADVLWGNDVHRTVTWQGRSDCSRLRGKALRLNFIGNGVKLYAFQFTE